MEELFNTEFPDLANYLGCWFPDADFEDLNEIDISRQFVKVANPITLTRIFSQINQFCQDDRFDLVDIVSVNSNLLMYSREETVIWLQLLAALLGDLLWARQIEQGWSGFYPFHGVVANYERQLDDKDWQILHCCLRAAALGTFFCGTALPNGEFKSLSGYPTFALYSTLTAWPSLDGSGHYRSITTELANHRKQLTRNALKAEVALGQRTFQGKAIPFLPPLRFDVYRLVDECLYYLLRTGLGPLMSCGHPDERREIRQVAWRRYLDVSESEADEVYERWRRCYIAMPLTGPLETDFTHWVPATAAKPLASDDIEVIVGQCLRAAVEGPFFKGLYYEPHNFASAIGTNWQQLRLLAQHWPDISSPQLLAQYAQLEQLNAAWQPPQTAEKPAVPLPTQSQVNSAIDCCLFYLTANLRFQQHPERYAVAEEAWGHYVGVPFNEADAAVQSWRVSHQHAVIEAIDAEEGDSSG